MRKDPYHPDWKPYKGPDNKGIGAQKVSVSKQPVYKTKAMVEGFENEREFYVTYLDEKQRLDYELDVVDGLLIHKAGPNAGKPVHTIGTGTNYIFVMDENGRIFASDHQPGFKHSSFLAGGPVGGAGTIVAHNGEVIYLSNATGHYRIKEKLNYQVIEELTNKELRTTRPIKMLQNMHTKTSVPVVSNIPAEVKKSFWEKVFFWRNS